MVLKYTNMLVLANCCGIRGIINCRKACWKKQPQGGTVVDDFPIKACLITCRSLYAKGVDAFRYAA